MSSLSMVARSALTAVAAYWAALWVLAGAIDLALDTSVEMAGVRQPLMLAWLAVAIALLGARFTPARIRVPAVLSLTIVLAVGTALARELTGLVAPWIQITMAAGVVLTTVGFVGPGRLFPLAVVLAGFVLIPQRWDEVTRANSPVELGVPLMEAALVLGLGLLAVLVRAVLVRSSEQADATMQLAEERREQAVAERWRQDALSRQMTLLHDTALNTLDAVALRPSGAVEEQRQRCVQDAERLRAFERTDDTDDAALPAQLDGLATRAQALGISLVVDVRGDDLDIRSLPDCVVTAVAGALDEAVLNVGKHSEATEAALRVDVGDGWLTAVLHDAGTGFDEATTPRRFGLRHSIEGRLAGVGGTATVRSAPGQGTSVLLGWTDSRERRKHQDHPVAEVVRRLVLALVIATTIVTSLFVVVEWRAFERPWIALGGSLVLGAWGLLVTGVLRGRRWIPTSIGVVTVAIACVAPFWTISADQFCSSSFATLGWIDPRIPLIVLVMVTAGHWWRASLAAPAFVAATIVAGRTWGSVFDGCQTWAETASVLAIAVFWASLIAGRTLNKQADAMARATEALKAERDETMRVAAVRSQRRQWFQPALDSCVPLLAAIGDGTVDPREDEVRRRCRAESGYLRGLLAAAGAPDGVREVVLDLVSRGHRAGLTIQTRGDFTSLPPADEQVLTALTDVLPVDLAGADTMAITALGGASNATLIVHIPGLTGSAPPASAGQADADVVLVVDDDGWWLAVSWSAAEPAAELAAGESMEAASR